MRAADRMISVGSHDRCPRRLTRLSPSRRRRPLFRFSNGGHTNDPLSVSGARRARLRFPLPRARVYSRSVRRRTEIYIPTQAPKSDESARAMLVAKVVALARARASLSFLRVISFFLLNSWSLFFSTVLHSTRISQLDR